VREQGDDLRLPEGRPLRRRRRVRPEVRHVERQSCGERVLVTSVGNPACDPALDGLAVHAEAIGNAIDAEAAGQDGCTKPLVGNVDPRKDDLGRVDGTTVPPRDPARRLPCPCSWPES
jgi:hypothetical protein